MGSISIIVSCYNEEDNIFTFFNKIKKVIKDVSFTIILIFIDDGSTDKTLMHIKNCASYKNIRNLKICYISFDRNYGHEAAMCAGLDASNSQYLIFMDVDMQNPPELLPLVIEKIRNYDCVLLKKNKNEHQTFFKALTSKMYYFISKYILFNKEEPNVSDFFAINNNIAKIIRNKYKTRLRYLRGFVQNESKKKYILLYNVEKRNCGISRYNYIKLIKLAISAQLSRISLFRKICGISNKKNIYRIKEKKLTDILN